MTNKTKLKELRKLLGSEKNWTKGVFARDSRNISCEPDCKKAVSFCLYGGCEKVGIRNPYPLFDGVIIQGLCHFNDAPETEHKDVLRAIDKAIRVCKN